MIENVNISTKLGNSARKGFSIPKMFPFIRRLDLAIYMYRGLPRVNFMRIWCRQLEAMPKLVKRNLWVLGFKTMQISRLLDTDALTLIAGISFC